MKKLQNRIEPGVQDYTQISRDVKPIATGCG